MKAIQGLKNNIEREIKNTEFRDGVAQWLSHLQLKHMDEGSSPVTG